MGEFDKYLVRVDGNNRVTCRNRKFLRKMTPFKVSSSTQRTKPSEWATPSHRYRQQSYPPGQERAGYPASRGSDLGFTRTGPPEPFWGEQPRAPKTTGGEQLESTPPPNPKVVILKKTIQSIISTLEIPP